MYTPGLSIGIILNSHSIYVWLSYMLVLPRMAQVLCHRSNAICVNEWWQRIPAILHVRAQTSALLKGSDAYSELCKDELELMETLSCIYTIKKQMDGIFNWLVQMIHTSFVKHERFSWGIINACLLTNGVTLYADGVSPNCRQAISNTNADSAIWIRLCNTRHTIVIGYDMSQNYWWIGNPLVSLWLVIHLTKITPVLRHRCHLIDELVANSICGSGVLKGNNRFVLEYTWLIQMN